MFGHGYPWLGLSLAVRGCTDVFIKIVENREQELPKKQKYKRDKQLPPIEPQLMLFPVETKDREKIAEMVGAVEYALMRNNRRALELPKADYARYEMIGWARRWPDEEWEPQLAKMRRVANGEIPDTEECLNLIEFLDKIERSAMYEWHNQSRGGGCF